MANKYPDIVYINIPNWGEYNQKKVVNPTWFRCQNDIFTDQKFMGLSGPAKLLWFYCLASTSKLDGERKLGTCLVGAERNVRISLVQARYLLGTTRVALERNLDGLVKSSMISLVDNNGQVNESSLQTEQTGEKYNKQDQDVVVDCDASNKTHNLNNHDASLRDAEHQNINNKKPKPSPELLQCIYEWQLTLRHFNISKDAKMDDYSIGELLRELGYEQVKYAIIGMRYEQATKTFDPAKHCAISRVNKTKELRDKLVNLGYQAANPNKERILTHD